MSWFNILGKRKQAPAEIDLSQAPSTEGIQQNGVANTSAQSHATSDTQESGIQLLFLMLERNYENKGYEDALVNSDSTHMDQNLEALKNDLERNIRKVKTFYQDFIREIDFHIESRSRRGMVDTVDELTMKKEIAQGHMHRVLEIEEDARNNRGDSQGIIMSYTKGFKNGLAAISHHSILKRKF